jgi:hypothetical protein
MCGCFVACFARNSGGSAARQEGRLWCLDPVADTIERKPRFAYTPSDRDNDRDGPTTSPCRPVGNIGTKSHAKRPAVLGVPPVRLVPPNRRGEFYSAVLARWR